MGLSITEHSFFFSEELMSRSRWHVLAGDTNSSYGLPRPSLKYCLPWGTTMILCQVQDLQETTDPASWHIEVNWCSQTSPQRGRQKTLLWWSQNQPLLALDSPPALDTATSASVRSFYPCESSPHCDLLQLKSTHSQHPWQWWVTQEGHRLPVVLVNGTH